MNKIHWTSSFSVGFQPIDDQHKIIIGLYNDLTDANSDTIALSAENTLGKYIDEHFQYELELMIKYKYPNLSVHAIDHNRLKDMYGIIKAKENNKSTVLKIVVYKWFIEHVGNDSMDKHLGSFLNKAAT